MKRMTAVLLTLLLFALVPAALAYSPEAVGAQNTPQDILDYLADSRWSGWEVTGYAEVGTYKANCASTFVAVKNGRANDLLAFRFDAESGRYVYLWHNAAALPQVEEPIVLGMAGDAGGQPRFQSYYVYNEEIQEANCFWAQEKNGVWNLEQMNVYYLPTLMFIDTSREGVIHMSNAGWVDGKETDTKIYGVYQRDLRYFSFNAFPRTVKEAREKLSNPPTIPGGSLTAKEVKFTSGKKYPVYIGPGEAYGRAANGKASVSTNDWIQVFGEENGYAMIQYDISSDKMRIGFIDASALPKGANVGELVYAPIAAKTRARVQLTDDPLGSQAPLAEIEEGTPVIWLATMGDWAYVQIDGERQLRGFIRMNQQDIDDSDG